MLITPSASEAERPAFEIKIALIGYVSVGKTTVLNALFRDTYGEVSMRCTTAGVNEFRIGTQKSKWKVVPEEASHSSSTGSVSSSSTTVTNVRTAESTLKEISADNVVLRECPLVKKKTFDIVLDEELCEMRDDTQLVIVDIPGINEAGASTKYKEYVTENWHTFDCVIVVMDGRQGVNTEEKLDLLALVKKNSREKKAVSVIILCNKVDEPEDEEQQLLLAEVREAIERIFDVKDCQGSLQKILDGAGNESSKKLSPVFVPLSAIHAFIYRTASKMNFEQFQKFDNALIGKLGRDNFVRSKWKRFSAESKKQKAFSVLSDPDQVAEGLEASNFVDVLKVLAYSVGGEKNQLNLIEEQLDIALSLISSKSCIATQVASIFDRFNALGMPTDNLKEVCSKELSVSVSQADQSFRDHPNVDYWAEPMKQLLSYYSFADGVGWEDEVERVMLLTKQLVYLQLEILFEKHASLTTDTWTPTLNDSDNAMKWSSLSPVDWDTIFASLLLLSFDRQFCELFGREKIILERLSHEMKSAVETMVNSRSNLSCLGCKRSLNTANQCTSCYHDYNYTDVGPRDQCPRCQTAWKCNSTCRCRSCGWTFKNHPDMYVEGALKTTYTGGTFEPKNPAAYKKIVHIPVPQSLSDPKHFGHLLWTSCRFVESLKEEN